MTTVEGYLNATERLGWSAHDYELWVGGLAETESIGTM